MSIYVKGIGCCGFLISTERLYSREASILNFQHEHNFTKFRFKMKFDDLQEVRLSRFTALE